MLQKYQTVSFELRVDKRIRQNGDQFSYNKYISNANLTEIPFFGSLFDKCIVEDKNSYIEYRSHINRIFHLINTYFETIDIKIKYLINDTIID